MLFRAKYFLLHQFTAVGAHSLHSPFVYKLYKEVIKKSSRSLVPEIEKTRKQLKKNRQILSVVDFKEGKSQLKSIASIAKTSLSRPKFSSFLKLLIDYIEAEIILETGTSLGVNTLYLSSALSSKKVITIEGSPIISHVANEVFTLHNNQNIESIQGSIYDVFISAIVKHQPNFVFLDADHRGNAIDFYIENILIHIPSVNCIIIHDIYWSKDMYAKWNEVVENKHFNLTIDIFQAGLIFPNLEMPKQHFKLKF